MLSEKLRLAIRDIPDFPKPGIIFKDITPILKDQALYRNVVEELVARLEHVQVDVVTGIESRGFLFGMLLAARLNVPFVPIRKQGKLPYATLSETYQLEYGEATIEMHTDAFEPGARVLIHDDLLATGGTVLAASRLVQKAGADVVGFAFLISLDFLNAKDRLTTYSKHIISLVEY